MAETLSRETVLKRYRISMGFFIFGLVVSGLTAFPLLAEMELLVKVLGYEGATTGVGGWLVTVRDGLKETYGKYPWVGYGTDWLAFAHLAIAVFFIGPMMDPRKNEWVVVSGLVACAGIIPLAFIAGAARGIPVGWRVIDCLFGVIGAVPLLYCLWLGRGLGAGNKEKDS